MKSSPPPPLPAVRTPRLPAKARKLEPNESVLCPDMHTTKCVRAHGRNRGWRMVQRQEKRGVRVWRLS